MKKLGFKLLLSGVALAACAATLSTTTYAWYVSNSEANATAVGGSTAAAGGDGNILVSKNKEGDATKPAAFQQNISFNGDTTNVKVPTKGLNPVSKDVEAGEGVTALKPTGENVTPTGWHSVDLSAVATTDAYMTFDIWVLSTKATSVTVELTTKNTTAETSVTKQTCYNASGAPADIAQGATFAIDAVEALRMEIDQYNCTDAAGTLPESVTNTGVYSVKAISKSYSSPSYFTTPGSADAQDYYNALLGKLPDGGDTQDDPTATFTTITVVANKPTKLSFKVWLEGRDSLCFDSCAGQTFTFDFKFTTPTEQA